MTHKTQVDYLKYARQLLDEASKLSPTLRPAWERKIEHSIAMLLEAVTNSQPVAQETTTDAPAQDCEHPRWKAYDQLSMGVTHAITNSVYRVFLHTCQTEGCKALNIGGTTYLPASK